MSESVIRACSKLLPSRHRCRQLEEREGACKLAIFSTSTFAWPVVRYVLPENSNDTLRGLLCRRHRTSSPDRRCRRGETRLEACQDPCRPRGLRVPKASSSILSLRIIGRSGAELAPCFLPPCARQNSPVFSLCSREGKGKMDESTGVHAITCRTRVPLSQKHLTTIFESVVDGGQEGGRGRER